MKAVRSAKEKRIKAEKGDTNVSCEDFADKVSLREQLKIKEGVRHTDIWRKSIPTRETASAKTLRQEHL